MAGLVPLDVSAMRELGRLQNALRTERAVVIFLDLPAGLGVAGRSVEMK